MRLPGSRSRSLGGRSATGAGICGRSRWSVGHVGESQFRRASTHAACTIREGRRGAADSRASQKSPYRDSDTNGDEGNRKRNVELRFCALARTRRLPQGFRKRQSDCRLDGGGLGRAPARQTPRVTQGSSRSSGLALADKIWALKQDALLVHLTCLYRESRVASVSGASQYASLIVCLVRLQGVSAMR